MEPARCHHGGAQGPGRSSSRAVNSRGEHGGAAPVRCRGISTVQERDDAGAGRALNPQTSTSVCAKYSRFEHSSQQTPAAGDTTRVNGSKLLEFRGLQRPLWIRRVLVRAQEGQSRSPSATLFFSRTRPRPPTRLPRCGSRSFFGCWSTAVVGKTGSRPSRSLCRLPLSAKSPCREASACYVRF
jgi:hypothetical protein